MTDTTDPVPPVAAAVTAGAAPWYKSQVQVAQVSAAVATVIAFLSRAPKIKEYISGFGLDDADTVSALIAAGALIWGIVARATSKVQPLTLTQAAATNHPSTQAVMVTQASMARAGIPTTAVTEAAITEERKQ